MKVDLFLCADADEIIELVLDEKEVDITPWWVEQQNAADADDKTKKEETKKEAATAEAAKVINAGITGAKTRKEVGKALNRFEFYKERCLEEYPDLKAIHAANPQP